MVELYNWSVYCSALHCELLSCCGVEGRKWPAADLASGIN